MKKGFTLIELIVVVAIIAVLSTIILFTVSQYINRGKDSNVAGNMAILIPAGEIVYNASGATYIDFCDPQKNNVIKNVIAQMPQPNVNGYCYDNPLVGAGTQDSSQWKASGSGAGVGNPAGICCYATEQAWVAWARDFSTPANVYCVDSRGMKEDVPYDAAKFVSTATKCP